jgi:hypothetical protein
VYRELHERPKDPVAIIFDGTSNVQNHIICVVVCWLDRRQMVIQQRLLSTPFLAKDVDNKGLLAVLIDVIARTYQLSLSRTVVFIHDAASVNRASIQQLQDTGLCERSVDLQCMSHGACRAGVLLPLARNFTTHWNSLMSFSPYACAIWASPEFAKRHPKRKSRVRWGAENEVAEEIFCR